MSTADASPPTTLTRAREALADSGMRTVPVVSLVERKVDNQPRPRRIGEKDLRELVQRKRLKHAIEIDHPVLWRGWPLGVHRWVDRRTASRAFPDADLLTFLLDVPAPDHRAGVAEGYLVSVTSTERHHVFFPGGRLAPSAYESVAEQLARILGTARG